MKNMRSSAKARPKQPLEGQLAHTISIKIPKDAKPSSYIWRRCCMQIILFRLGGVVKIDKIISDY
jgi:hypothetical protein